MAKRIRLPSKELRLVTLKFLTVGVAGFVVNYLILHTLTDMSIQRLYAEIVAMLLALNLTFVLHDKWTYRNKNDEYQGTIGNRYWKYLLSNSAGSLMTILGFVIFAKFINSNLIALGLGAIAGTAWNYFMNLFVIWKHGKHAD